jgi:hypothetical protein
MMSELPKHAYLENTQPLSRIYLTQSEDKKDTSCNIDNNSINNKENDKKATDSRNINENSLDNIKQITKAINLSCRGGRAERCGRKIARIDPDIAEHLNISAGDALELSSARKKTTVLSWPAREGDRGMRLIRIDGHIRNKLFLGI